MTQSRFIVIIRPEFMGFCGDACRAAALNHLLFRIAGKCKDQPKEKIQAGEILWYGSNELITEEMSNAWGVCKVRKEVNELIGMSLFGKTSNPEWGADRTKHFFFGTDQCAKFLQLCEEHNICFVHLDLPDEVKHLIYSSNANDKSIKCLCPNDKSIECKSYIHQMEAMNISNANDKSIEAITKNTTKINNKEDYEERESITAHVLDTSTAVSPHVDTARASSPLEEYYHSLLIPVTYNEAIAYLAPHGGPPPGYDAVQVMKLAQKLWVEAHEEEDITQAETVKVPVVSKQNTPTSTPAQPPIEPSVSMVSPQFEQVAPGPSVQQTLQAPEKRQSAKREKKAEPAKPEFTPEGETLYQDWCSLFHVNIPRTKAIILAANDLYEPIAYWSEKLDIPRAEVLKRIMNWQYKNNPNYYGEGRGVKLFDVQRDIEGWISAAERKLARDALKVVPVAEDKSRQFSMAPIILESKRKGALRGKALAPAH